MAIGPYHSDRPETYFQGVSNATVLPKPGYRSSLSFGPAVTWGMWVEESEFGDGRKPASRRDRRRRIRRAPARQAPRWSVPVRITIVDRRNHHLFQPLLYQVATASLGPADIAWPIRQLFHTPNEVTRVSPRWRASTPRRREVMLETPALRFDPSSRHRRLTTPTSDVTTGSRLRPDSSASRTRPR